MKNANWKDVAVRAAKTFIEAFVAFVSAELAGVDIFTVDKSMWLALGVSAAAAGVSAVWNGLVEPAVKSLLKAE